MPESGTEPWTAAALIRTRRNPPRRTPWLPTSRRAWKAGQPARRLLAADQPVAVAGLAALAIATGYDRTDLAGFMHAYMGVFLLVCALLKLFNPVGFADGVEMYDLLARRVRAYGHVYPYLELALGLAYLSFFMPIFTYVATVVLSPSAQSASSWRCAGASTSTVPAWAACSRCHSAR